MKKVKNTLLAVACLVVPALSLHGATMQQVAAELNAYIGTHDEGIQESVPNAFHGQFNPILPLDARLLRCMVRIRI